MRLGLLRVPPLAAAGRSPAQAQSSCEGCVELSKVTSLAVLLHAMQWLLAQALQRCRAPQKRVFVFADVHVVGCM